MVAVSLTPNIIRIIGPGGSLRGAGWGMASLNFRSVLRVAPQILALTEQPVNIFVRDDAEFRSLPGAVAGYAARPSGGNEKMRSPWRARAPRVEAGWAFTIVRNTHRVTHQSFSTSGAAS